MIGGVWQGGYFSVDRWDLFQVSSFQTDLREVSIHGGRKTNEAGIKVL